MKKILMLLNVILFPVLLNLAVCACTDIIELIIHKVPLTRRNLKAFFKENNTFTRTGEFFFKSADMQTKTETLRMTKERIENIFKSLLDQSLGQKIRNHFIYNASEYYFKIIKLAYVNEFELNKSYNFSFQLEIIGNKDSFYFKQDNLVLKFTETKQYNDARWLEIYLSYLENCCTFLWQQKYTGYEKTGSLPYHPDAEWTTKHSKTAFQKDNDPVTLNFLSNYYTNLFSDSIAYNKIDFDKNEKLWFYVDKQFKVNATKYKYLGNTPAINLYQNGGVRAEIILNFTSMSDRNISANHIYEIWMPYKRISGKMIQQ